MCAKLHSNGKQPLCDATDTLLTQLMIDTPSLPDKFVLVHFQACGTVEDTNISHTFKCYISLRIFQVLFKQSKPDYSRGTNWRKINHAGSVSYALMRLNESSLTKDILAYLWRI